VLFEAADPFSRRVVVDIGGNRGVKLGSPVINEAGVIGQVTRVYPLSAEVTLLTDKDAAIPVLNARSRQRGIAFGSPAAGGLEMRFMAGSADILEGDALVTSGLDGIYPAGLPVARVRRVDRRAESGFARIELDPVSPLDDVRHVLLLDPISEGMPVRPDPPPAAAAPSAAPASAPGRGRR
jgi:rod shape-determining protein MreC